LDSTIPEFPSFLIVTLFVIVTLLAVIVQNRKRAQPISKDILDLISELKRDVQGLAANEQRVG